MGTKIFTDRYFAVILPNNYKAFEMTDHFSIWTQTDSCKTVGNTSNASLKSDAVKLCFIEGVCHNVLNTTKEGISDYASTFCVVFSKGYVDCNYKHFGNFVRAVCAF